MAPQIWLYHLLRSNSCRENPQSTLCLSNRNDNIDLGKQYFWGVLLQILRLPSPAKPTIIVVISRLDIMASQTDRLLHSGWLSTNNIASPSFGNPHNQCCTAALEQLVVRILKIFLMEMQASVGLVNHQSMSLWIDKAWQNSARIKTLCEKKIIKLDFFKECVLKLAKNKLCS